MMNTPDSVLQKIIEHYRNVEVGELSELSAYARTLHKNPADTEIFRTFKRELRYALDHPGFVTPALYEQWTGNDEYGTQVAVQEHLEEIWDACFGNEGTKIILKEYLKNCLNPQKLRLEEMANGLRTVKGQSQLESAQFFKGELLYALDHPGFITPELYEKWTTQPMADQGAVQHRLQEIWDKCFG